jgi:[NiFe] hydrogenase small subunit
MDNEQKAFYERLESKGVSRRDFMKYCTFLTATMGLSSSFVPKVAEVFAAPAKSDHRLCGSISENVRDARNRLLRSMYPFIDELVLEILSRGIP